MKKIILIGALVLFSASFGTTAFAGGKHLIYLNGCCLEKVGVSGYNTIVKKLKKDGFDVSFEPRYDDSSDSMDEVAQKTTAAVQALLASGTKPDDIVVAGYSLGSVIAMYSSLQLNNPNVRFVLLAGCPVHTPRHFAINYVNLHGKFLSIIDKYDDKFGSCGKNLSGATSFDEVTIDSGSGHKGFRLSSNYNYKKWEKPMESWLGK